ncbi:hypothetical protein A9J92_03950 [Staphylococcus epidermidis]|uniref:hypothetical protein n=1 Tax=Staphylococcus epidermidis TaxID=1282 RepID=UPI0007E32060|nr:hypothetical protein [Staphylococcus epidermidis]OAX04920.1 hypothetical protein A9J92_03950 [Staphylococcus epidermidis]
MEREQKIKITTYDGEIAYIKVKIDNVQGFKDEEAQMKKILKSSPDLSNFGINFKNTEIDEVKFVDDDEGKIGF